MHSDNFSLYSASITQTGMVFFFIRAAGGGARNAAHRAVNESVMRICEYVGEVQPAAKHVLKIIWGQSYGMFQHFQI